MKDILTKYFSLNSTSSVSQGNSIAIFCAIVAVFAFCYSLNMSSHRGIHFVQPNPTVANVEESAEETPDDEKKPALNRISHKK